MARTPKIKPAVSWIHVDNIAYPIEHPPLPFNHHLLVMNYDTHMIVQKTEHAHALRLRAQELFAQAHALETLSIGESPSDAPFDVPKKRRKSKKLGKLVAKVRAASAETPKARKARLAKLAEKARQRRADAKAKA